MEEKCSFASFSDPPVPWAETEGFTKRRTEARAREWSVIAAKLREVYNLKFQLGNFYMSN